jgi:prolyl oligopeptidase
MGDHMRGAYLGIFLGLLTIGCSAGARVAPQSVANDEDFDKTTAWLEEVEGDKALGWVRGLNKKTQTHYEADPRFAAFKAEFEHILMAKDRIPISNFVGNHLYNFWQDDKSVRGVWRRTSLTSYRTANPKWETVLDIDQLADVEKENWVYKGATCYPNSESRCFIYLSRGGKDAKVVREFDLKTKQFIADGFNLPEAKSDTVWWEPDSVLVRTDWGPGSLTKSGYARHIRLWNRGEDHTKAPNLFSAKEEDVGADVWVSRSLTHKALFFIRYIDFFNQEIFWIGADFKDQRKLPMPTDAISVALHQGQFVFSLRSPWVVQTPSGKFPLGVGTVASFSLDHWLKTGTIDKINVVFEPTNTQAFDEVSENKDALFVAYLDNVEGKLRRYQWTNAAWVGLDVAIPPHLSVGILDASPFRAQVLLRVEGFLEPMKVLYTPDGITVPTKIKQAPARFERKGVRVDQFWARSGDGTLIPYYVIGKATGANKAKPTILNGYGGFSISMTPWYLSGVGKSWIERGGQFVVANIRGGGEFGPAWHTAVLKENRPKVFEDFIGVAEDLIAKGLTTPQQLGTMGGSNGGLLVGATAVKRPDLFKAVSCSVPLLDMLNYHKWLAGDSWKGEYGDPEDPEMRKVLLSYSPVHNVQKGVRYPEILFTTSTKDDRVHPAHARKMAYVFEQIGQPFQYFENIEGGHGAAANLKQRAYRSALEFTYFSQALGLPRVQGSPLILRGSASQ